MYTMPFNSPTLSITRRNVADRAIPSIIRAAVRQVRGRTCAGRVWRAAHASGAWISALNPTDPTAIIVATLRINAALRPMRPPARTCAGWEGEPLIREWPDGKSDTLGPTRPEAWAFSRLSRRRMI